MDGKSMESRKYIDMIYRTSARFPNWNPSKPLKVGDYGTINPQSGEFELDGSIYSDKDILEKVPILRTKEGQPIDGGADDQMVICGENTTSTVFDMGGSTDLGTFAQSRLKLEFKMVAPGVGHSSS